jgi:NAD(P)-dependent dehydrogenase (short-subunit alcohol dehydrogenase family)
MAAGAAYTASKHGLVGLTKSIAAFYTKKGIRAVAIMPGAMQTNMAEAHDRKYHEEGVAMAGGSFMGDIVWNPLEEVSKTILCLCSDGMNTISGAFVPTDSGWTAI